MAKNNLLLGNGQALVGPTAWPLPVGKKAEVYSIQEARAHLHPQLELFAQQAADVPPAAAARGEVVGKVLVHPEYLAKSHFPAGVLRSAGLRTLGTRSRMVQPRHRLRKRKPDEPMLTAELLVAGGPAAFEYLDRLLMNSPAIGVRRDLSRIEDITMMAAADRVRAIRPFEDGTVLLEAVLHASAADSDIIRTFGKWAGQCNGEADLRRAISVEGLTFLPVRLPKENVQALGAFSHVRVLRSVAALRSHEGGLRSAGQRIVLPRQSAEAVTDEFRVAVFDGGLGVTVAGVQEYTWPRTAKTSAEYLDHGAAVTSALMFGPVPPGAAVLPQAYAPVDHYRVATPHDERDPEMFDAVNRICEVLDRGEHRFVNISLAPASPVEDDDVHLWTSVLEPRLAAGSVLAVVAAGNSGEHTFPESRIQVPADMVNGLAVGSAAAPAGPVVRAAHSSVGPGRSPGLVKPDGLAWGDAVPLYNLRVGGTIVAEGSSFAAPLALRAAVGAAALAHGVTPAIARALAIHTTERSSKAGQSEIGHGRFCLDPLDLVTCGDREAMVVYEGQLEPGRPVGAALPWPDGDVFGKVRVRATLLFHTAVDVAHPINYTRAGIEARLRRSEGGNTVSFFSKAKLYGQSEQELRADAHKWETVLSKEIGLNADTLDDPMLELVYRARDEGLPISNASLEPLPYVLVVTVSAIAEPDFYNRVRQRYPVLLPVRLRAGVVLPTRGGSV